jgi:hypothetical protein
MNQSVMVFSNSTARSAALTSPVEGMITYLEDTAVYESYDGAAWVEFGASAPSGLTLITNFTASAVSSIDINGCFSATYDNYLISIRGLTSTGSRVEARMRNSGTTDSSANYDSQILSVDGGTLVPFRNGGGTTGWMSGFFSTESASSVDIFSPFIARPTIFQGNSFSPFNNALIGFYGFRHRTSSSYDSLTLLPGSGTMTLTGSIYGYAK